MTESSIMTKQKITYNSTREIHRTVIIHKNSSTKNSDMQLAKSINKRTTLTWFYIITLGHTHRNMKI